MEDHHVCHMVVILLHTNIWVLAKCEYGEKDFTLKESALVEILIGSTDVALISTLLRYVTMVM